MGEKYEIVPHSNQASKGYEIKKIDEGNFTVKELKKIFDNLINEGMGDYIVHHEGFCCGSTSIDISETFKEISLD